MKKILSIFAIFMLFSCNHDNLLYRDINLRIVSFNSDCSLSNDKFQNPQLCNTILFETISGKKQYYQVNTCQMSRDIKIDTKWLYNHRIGDTVHFDALGKDKFFTIDR